MIFDRPAGPVLYPGSHWRKPHGPSPPCPAQSFDVRKLPENADGTTRPSLQRYSTTYLRFVWTLAASVLIMTYGLWAFELRELDDTVLPALSTAPFVLAVLRYAVVVDAGEAGEPEEILLRDRVLQALGVVWVVLVAVAVYG